MKRETLCKLGLHKWEYFNMSDTFIKMFPNEVKVGRTCPHCLRLEYQNYKTKIWHRGLRGSLENIT